LAAGAAPRSAVGARGVMVRLALLLVLNGAVISGLVWLVSPAGHKDTVLRHSWDTLRGNSGDDSWDPLSIALNYLRSGQTAPLYEAVFFKGGVRYQYPPSALFALAAMQAIAPDRVLVDDQKYSGPRPTINDMVGWVFLLLMAGSVAGLLEVARRRAGMARGSPGRLALRVALIAGLTLTFYPVVKAFTLGQVQVWVNAVFAAALLCWVTGRRSGAGLLIGLVCLFKPHYGVFLIWASLRREWRFVTACAAAVGAGVAASVVVFGWANHLDYLRVLSFLSERGESYYPNQSVNGLLNRLMSIAEPQAYNNVVWREGHFPPFTPWIYYATLATSVAFLLAALARRQRDGDPGRVRDFCTMLVSLTIASPIAWEHHYGVLLPVYVLMVVAIGGDTRRFAWLVLSYALVANFVPATNLLAPGIFNVAQSHLLFGALLLLVLLHGRTSEAAASARAEGVAKAPVFADAPPGRSPRLA
jgi:hypothetical protein